MKSILRGASLLLALVFASQSHAAEYLVKYKNQKAFQSIFQMASVKSTGMTVLDVHEPGSFVKVDLRQSGEVLALARLASNPDIEWVTPNIKLHAFTAPVDVKALKEQWAMAKVNAEQAWARANNRGFSHVLVAVIDTGMDYRHQNLVRNAVPGYDFNGGDADPMDETSSRNPGHGTHCGGIIAADGLVDGGIVGMAPGVSVMPIRFLGADGSGDLANGIKSIDYAIEKGADVISASWGATVRRSQATALIEAVKRANDAGVIFVAAAANDGRSNDVTDVFPANAVFENTITVAASGSTDAKPSWSNYGKRMVHLASPGEGIMSTLPGDKYGNLSGTSMATPLVSGLVAFLKSQDTSLTGAQIRALLQTTGAKAKIETACNCRVDAFAAVDTLMSRKMWMVPAGATINAGETQALTVMNGAAPFKFASSNPTALTVDENGVVSVAASATAGQSAIITATDANGQSVSSVEFYAGKGAAEPPGNSCPFNQSTCDWMCGYVPSLPWCAR